MSNTSRSKVRGRRTEIESPGPVTRAQVSSLDAHLGYWLRAVSNQVSHSFKVMVEREGVTVAEWVVLRALFDREGAKPSDLADRIGLTRGAVSKLVDRLMTKDLVAVRSDAQDGRAQLLSLKSEGRRLVPKLAAIADENDARAFGKLDDARRAQLRSILMELVAHLGVKSAPME